MGFFERLGNRVRATGARPAPPPPPPPPPPRPAEDVVLLHGNHPVQVVGESYYQEALSRICGGETPEGHRLDVIATLVPEPDNPYDKNAVGVYVDGQKVGHLSRDHAAECHQPLTTRMNANGKAVGCRAQIRGGWNRGDGDEGSFGIELYFSQEGLT